MTDQLVERAPDAVDELGPVDWIVVEFPGSSSRGELAPLLEDLVSRGTVRILDLPLMKKAEDGTLEFFEIGDLGDGQLGDGELGGLRAYEAGLAMLLSEEDVTAVAEALAPGSTAALLVWENLWAAPFASAVRRAGGLLAASGCLWQLDGCVAQQSSARRTSPARPPPWPPRRSWRTGSAAVQTGARTGGRTAGTGADGTPHHQLP